MNTQRVLLLLAQKKNRRLLSDWLTNQGHQVLAADATAAALATDFDLAIVDGPMLDRHRQAIQDRRKMELPVFLPVLFVTAHKEVRLITRHLWITVDELIYVPVERLELLARVKILLRMRALSLEVEHLAITDPLTELFNRRHLFNIGEREFARARRQGLPLSCIMADIDHFKSVNDQYGHEVGDEVLCSIAQRLQSVLREVDVLARYGGEEFVALLPDTPGQEALEVAERLRHTITDVPVTTSAGAIQIRISLGVAQLSPEMNGLDDLINAADMALYSAKREGRDRSYLRPE